jgi:GNAT superfamily N-acetyltransferase
MTFLLREEPIGAVAELLRIPIGFEVDRMLEVAHRRNGSEPFEYSERRFEVPYIKDYDQIEGEGPTRWAQRFDLSRWGLIGAYADGSRIGAAVVAFATAGVDLLEGRGDLAVLWDIRVHPSRRREGVGAALFQAAADWAAGRGCTQLKVETQNINVPACRFYERQGCVLGQVDRAAYPQFPDEIQLMWYKDLRGTPTAGNRDPARGGSLRRPRVH